MNRITAYILAIFCAFLSQAQPPFGNQETENAPIEWMSNARLEDNTQGIITITADILPGWHLYGMNMPKGGPKPTRFIFAKDNTQTATYGKMQVDKPTIKKHDALFDSDVEYWEGKVVFKQKFKLNHANSAKSTIKLKIEYMGCNDRTCLPPSVKEFELRILPPRKK